MKVDNAKIVAYTRCEDDYFTGRFVFAKLGGLFAKVLLHTPFTPNQITWFWGGLMLLSSLLYATGDYFLGIAGGAVWIVAYALDYTDGVIARYKELTSPKGEFLDMIIHRITYITLMFCIGYGVYASGGCRFVDFAWFDNTFYIYLGVAAGLSMNLFMDALPLYKRFKKDETVFEDNKGSMGIEAKMVKNQSLFRKLMNFNPLVFTNMKVCLLIFAVLDAMGIFIIFYGIGYTVTTAMRVMMLYRDL